MVTVQLEISGKVQGVFFRASAKEIAEKFKITGWIRNKDDGDVEARITGESAAVQEFITWCNNGPAKAKVENVLVSHIGLENFDSFRVIR